MVITSTKVFFDYISVLKVQYSIKMFFLQLHTNYRRFFLIIYFFMYHRFHYISIVLMYHYINSIIINQNYHYICTHQLIFNFLFISLVTLALIINWIMLMGLVIFVADLEFILHFQWNLPSLKIVCLKIFGHKTGLLFCIKNTFLGLIDS